MLSGFGFYEKTNVSSPSQKEKEAAAELLAYVEKADYGRIRGIWLNNPALMLIEVKDKNGFTTTPLKRAFYNQDTYTWKPFYDYLNYAKPELLQEFYKQKDAQNEVVDIEPLLTLYAEYRDQVKAWQKNTRDDTRINAMWLELRRAQRKILPWHVIREMCRDNLLSRGYQFADRTWKPDSPFDVTQLPAPEGGHVYNSDKPAYVPLDSDDFEKDFGTKATLMRGEGFWRNAQYAWTTSWGDWLEYDAATFKRLFEVRNKDLFSLSFRELLDPLSLDPVQKPSYTF